MSEIVAGGPEYDRKQELSCRGRWWIPGPNERRVTGVLTFSPDDGGNLTLDGSLGDPRSQRHGKPSTVIFGETNDGLAVSVLDGHYSGSQERASGETEDVSEERWMFFVCVSGAHLEHGYSTLCNSAALSTRMLSEWAIDGSPRDTSEEPGKFRIETDVPESISASLQFGEIELKWLSSQRWSHRRVSVSVNPNVVVSFDTPVAIDTIWDVFVTPTLYFMAFVTGDPDRVVQLTASREVDSETELDRQLHGDKKSQWFTVYSVAWTSSIPNKESRFWEFPLPLSEARERFATLLPKWFLICESISDALLEFFSITLEPGMFLEDSFSRSVRSTEIWHRKMVGGTIMSRDKFSSLLDKLHFHCTREEWDLVQMRMRYGNELTQKARLDDAIKRAGPLLVDLVGRYKKTAGTNFTRAVVDMRNEMAHGQDGEDPPLTNSEMVWAMRTLQAVFMCNLMNELGFSEDEIKGIVTRWTIWKVLDSPFNDWLKVD